MKKIRQLLVLSLLLLYTFVCFGTVSLQNETLNYVVSYKWGVLHKEAMTAKITLRQTSGEYNITVTASTKPWADKYFAIRDTLKSSISKSNFKPLKYTKITHEGGKYRRDVLSYSYVKEHAYGKCNRYKRDSKGKVTQSVKTCSATGPTYDMVSIFYYIRTLDYSRLSEHRVAKATIFSGSAPETITIRNLGIETVKMPDGKKYRTYHLRFTFTTNAGKDTSMPMNAWVTADDRRTPVKLVGDLSFGKVQAFLTRK